MDQNLIFMETMLHQRGGGGHDQIISSHHPIGDEVAKMEIEMFIASISWEKKAKPDLRKVCQNSKLPDAGINSPKTHPEPP